MSALSYESRSYSLSPIASKDVHTTLGSKICPSIIELPQNKSLDFTHEDACRMAELQRRSSRSHCQQMRGFRCPALAPVLEHYEASEEEEELSMETPNSETAGALAQPTGHCNAVKKCTTKLWILSKLRDGYVKLLNDVACRADYSGASSFYVCPAGGADYSAAFYARLHREEREKQARLQAMGQGQQRTQQSRMIFTGAFA